MRLMSMLAAAAAVVLAAQDGGVGVRGAAAQDAGVPAPRAPSVADGGVAVVPTPVPEKPQTVVIDRTAELQQMREELRLMQATAAEMTAKLDAAVSELRQVKEQLAQQQQAAVQQQELRKTQQEAAVSLSAVDQRLATGDTTVSGLMQTLGASLGPASRLSLENARAALTNNDVATARMFLSQAILEAQAGR